MGVLIVIVLMCMAIGMPFTWYRISRFIQKRIDAKAKIEEAKIKRLPWRITETDEQL